VSGGCTRTLASEERREPSLQGGDDAARRPGTVLLPALAQRRKVTTPKEGRPNAETHALPRLLSRRRTYAQWLQVKRVNHACLRRLRASTSSTWLAPQACVRAAVAPSFEQPRFAQAAQGANNPAATARVDADGALATRPAMAPPHASYGVGCTLWRRMVCMVALLTSPQMGLAWGRRGDSICPSYISGIRVQAESLGLSTEWESAAAMTRWATVPAHTLPNAGKLV
jgi:hypothetical protein